ncbi:probable phosphoglycerate mutase [Andreprevotia lacus DSM 23236]|uniref:Probable phosphoglycerate mutase n=1 Tax=Andreprevotia lacus DSM 23236 TaxID=1121001 RepID=A0A1W1XFM9_9NEIS|nr:histidine phosphatase family protein [Andreprevotia lacus]SMC22647.1 probable phosphoglycerate mutase [Andreprevotia lacus DSM 23236]
MLTPVPFYFLRHGETDWNAAYRAQGRQDIPLNTRGRQQARDAALRLHDCGIRTICSSPLLRARETADIIAQGLGLSINTVQDLQEAHLGPFEGSMPGRWLQRWRGGHTDAGMESHAGFQQRTQAAIHEALTQPGPVLIVAHGGTHAVLQQLTRIIADTHQTNAQALFFQPPDALRSYWSSTLI